MTVYIVVLISNAHTTNPYTQVTQVYANREDANARALELGSMYTVATVMPREVLTSLHA